MSLFLNGVLYTNIEDLNIAISSYSEEQKQFILNDFNGIENTPAVDPMAQVQMVIANAIVFGGNLISQFAAENVMMGITQDGMTGTVRKNMSEVLSALQTGSLYDVILEVKSLTADKKDAKYITDARLLQFINKIEDYLQIPRSTSL